jgi:nucleoside-diphosphate-sugar epimerase
MNLQGKRVLVTGAEGFIGSHLVEHLLRTGARVTALAKYNSFNFWGWLEDIPSLQQIQVLTGDIRDSHFRLSLAENVAILRSSMTCAADSTQWRAWIVALARNSNSAGSKRSVPALLLQRKRTVAVCAVWKRQSEDAPSIYFKEAKRGCSTYFKRGKAGTLCLPAR